MKRLCNFCEKLRDDRNRRKVAVTASSEVGNDAIPTD